MSRGKSVVTINRFVAGLITEASPLTFPDNASMDEQNFILNTDGSRSRRDGMDLEPSSIIITSPSTLPASGDLAFSSFKWNNAGGNPEKTLIVVQIGQNLNFFDGSGEAVSLGYDFTYTYTDDLVSQRFSYAVVDGMLVVVTGKKSVDIYEYDIDLDQITRSERTLYIRDLFGLEDIASA